MSTEYSSPLTTSNNNGDWYWDNTTYTLSYMVINKNTLPFLDVEVQFSAIKCRYVGCKAPENPGFRAPVTSRPSTALFWSDSATWGGRMPQNLGDVLIPDGAYIVVDVALPKLSTLTICGILEFDNDRDHYLEVNMIFVNGGQLIIGWENDPILTNVEIVLTGEKNSLQFILPNGMDKIGGKGMGVYGGLDIHGKPRDVPWTRLNGTVTAGSSAITLVQPVDWKVGERVLITTTSYILEQTEIMTISAVSADMRVISFSAPLLYDHLAFTMPRVLRM